MAQLRLPESYYGKNVTKCSGGERQRVALARALAYEPDILFFDEPLSAIDYKLRKTLEKELKDIHRETGKTFIYITHSLEEAMVMSDRIGVMRSGKLVQVGRRRRSIPHRAPNSSPSSSATSTSSRSTADGADHVNAAELGVRLKSPPLPAGFGAGYVVVRPEFAALRRQRRRNATTASKACSTTNMCSARASSTRCGWANTSSSSRSCGSRVLPVGATTRC